MSDLPAFRPAWMNLSKQPSSTTLSDTTTTETVDSNTSEKKSKNSDNGLGTPPALIADFILPDDDADLPDSTDEDGRWESLLQQEEEEEKIEEAIKKGDLEPEGMPAYTLHTGIIVVV